MPVEALTTSSGATRPCTRTFPSDASLVLSNSLDGLTRQCLEGLPHCRERRGGDLREDRPVESGHQDLARYVDAMGGEAADDADGDEVVADDGLRQGPASCEPVPRPVAELDGEPVQDRTHAHARGRGQRPQ